MTFTPASELYDASDYPNFFILSAIGTLDFFCRQNSLTSSHLHCSDWRQWMNCKQGTDWCANYYEQSILDAMPDTTTFRHFQQQNYGFFDDPDRLATTTGDVPTLLNQLYQYAFQTPTTAMSVLTTPTAIIVLLFLILVLRAIKSVLLPWFRSIGRRAGRATHGALWEKDNEIRIVKFGEYVFRLIFHSTISLYGMVCFWNVPWWSDTTLLFDLYPHQPVAPAMTWYYLIQGAYNLEALFSLLEMSLQIKWSNQGKNTSLSLPTIAWSNTVRGDFREMFVHHIVTNLLVLGSSFFRLSRIGSMVFLVHDISDIPVDLSKLANFLKWRRATTVCFGTMVLFWLFFRLTILPFVIYRSVLFESHLVMKSGYIEPHVFLLYVPLFYYLVGQIILLHIAWFAMMLRMGYVLVFKGEHHDLTEHKQGEEQDTNGVHGTKNGETNQVKDDKRRRKKVN